MIRKNCSANTTTAMFEIIQVYKDKGMKVRIQSQKLKKISKGVERISKER